MDDSRPFWIPFLETEYGNNALCLELSNTLSRNVGEWTDTVATYPELVDWAVSVHAISKQDGEMLLVRFPEQPERSTAVMEQAREAREAVFQVFSAVAAGREPMMGHIAIVERYFRQSMAHVKLAGSGAEVSWESQGSRLDSPLWPCLLSAVELLTSPLLARVRECASDDCGWLFLDLSRNRSRRWCDMQTCGNRNKARRFQSRRGKG